MNKDKALKNQGAHEVACYAVAVACGFDMASDLAKAETLFRKVQDIAKPMHPLCACIAPKRTDAFAILFPVADVDGEARANQVVAMLAENGLKADILKEPVYADNRYIEGRYQHFVVSLPPDDVEERIVSLMDKYCHDWEAKENPMLDTLFYEGDIGGGRMVCVFVQSGNRAIGAGISGGEMRYSRSMSKEWPNVLSDFESDLDLWVSDHPGIAKRANAA